MSDQPVAIRFNDTSYSYNIKKPIITAANFTIRQNAKITIMGQNGAGKSTIFKLLTEELKPTAGNIHIQPGASIAIARQVLPRHCLELTVRGFFETAFAEKKYDLDRSIAQALDAVNLVVPLERELKRLSGGQQARLLLAHALIQKPDILLLDEPTNNLDTAGIEHLTGFLLGYEKTVIVISHDADFLNTFTDGVLHLDVFTHQVHQFVGNYFDVVEEISAQIEREQRKNAQLQKNIQDRKDKVNFFSHKGGKMRALASKLRDEIEESESELVDVRKEDKTIRPFIIPVQEVSNPILHLKSVGIMAGETPIQKAVDITLRKKEMLHIVGPNGIGKTTLLEALASQQEPGLQIVSGVRVGHYRQDFSGLDFDLTPFQALQAVQTQGGPQAIFEAAAHFLLTGDLLQQPIGSLSEGQKGLLCYARFMVQEPALLILDEPTNHINFRHLPVIAEALNEFAGAIIVVCHDQTFVDQLQITETLDLGALR
ncbi:MAG: ABC-F family ATP-binding cassette domain-containing protein [Candidatus Kerfeldbacteria bacterium]|nr:ABC-F family ATP-binding cassette domain-containing protein [Candidatus Kerfeldbacteria bacterium]